MADEDESQGSGAASQKTNPTKRRSSLLTRARMSFYRSRGQSGASVETLRGNSGSDFEAYAKVIRGGGGEVSLCGCLGGGGDVEAKKKPRFILIKGAFCFVFTNQDAPAPKFAVELKGTKAVVQAQSGHHRTVLLETTLGDVEYKFIFDVSEEENLAHRFAAIVAEQAAVAEADMVKKRLGHNHLLPKKASVKYAENIAMKKVKEQPEAPITAAEVMAQAPTVGM